MKTKYTTLLASGAIAAMMAMTACSGKEPEFIGNWQSAQPLDVTTYFPGANSAVKDMDIDFVTNQEYTGGPITVSNHYRITYPLTVDSLPNGKYTASFTVNAKCEGTWTFDVDDSDDLLIRYNYDGLSVTLDPESIQVAPSDPIALRQARSHSEAWKMDVREAFRRDLLHFSSIDDVDVSKDRNSMKLEVQDPKEDLRFTRKL